MGQAPPNDFDRVIADYYDRAPEEARLGHGPFQLEEARTRELILRYASRWASALDGLARDLLQDPWFALIVEQDRGPAADAPVVRQQHGVLK